MRPTHHHSQHQRQPHCGSAEITELLASWGDGDAEALETLVPLVYRELRVLAARELRGERANHTLQTTALVHEAFLRLSRSKQVRCQSRAHFFSLLAQTMRRVLVDHARAVAAARRGGGSRPLPLDTWLQIPQPVTDPGLLELHEALEELATRDPRLVRLVELRFFGGLDNAEIAELLGVSQRTVIRRWRTAQAWLFRCLRGEARGG